MVSKDSGLLLHLIASTDFSGEPNTFLSFPFFFFLSHLSNVSGILNWMEWEQNPGWFNSVTLLFSIHREETSLVDQFVFEVLVIFVESLALAHSDEQSMGNNYSFLFIGISDTVRLLSSLNSYGWLVLLSIFFKSILNVMTFAFLYILALAESCNTWNGVQNKTP